MKKFISEFKALWSNRRYRAIIILIIYASFFSFVFFFLSSLKPVEIKLKGLDLLEKTSNYKITDINNNIPIEEFNKIKKQLSLNKIYETIKKATLESTNYINKTNTYIINNFSINDKIYDVKIITYEIDDKIVKIELFFEQYILQVEVEY